MECLKLDAGEVDPKYELDKRISIFFVSYLFERLPFPFSQLWELSLDVMGFSVFRLRVA